MAFVNRCRVDKSKEVMMNLSQTVVQPQVDFWVQFFRRYVQALERLYKRFVRRSLWTWGIRDIWVVFVEEVLYFGTEEVVRQSDRCNLNWGIDGEERLLPLAEGQEPGDREWWPIKKDKCNMNLSCRESESGLHLQGLQWRWIQLSILNGSG